jgi:hypothetical protein
MLLLFELQEASRVVMCARQNSGRNWQCHTGGRRFADVVFTDFVAPLFEGAGGNAPPPSACPLPLRKQMPKSCLLRMRVLTSSCLPSE